MQELMKKRPTEMVEARFIGKPDDILRFRRLAKEYRVVDVTDFDTSLEDE